MKKTVIIISFILALLFVWAIPINAEDVDFSQPTKQGVFLRMDDIDDFTDFINGSRSEKERTIKKLQTFDYTDEEIDKMIAFSDKVCENFYYLLEVIGILCYIEFATQSNNLNPMDVFFLLVKTHPHFGILWVRQKIVSQQARLCVFRVCITSVCTHFYLRR